MRKNMSPVYKPSLPAIIFDDMGNVVQPNDWPTENPTGAQMYSLIEQFLFMRLQDQQGENGIGAGTIT